MIIDSPTATREYAVGEFGQPPILTGFVDKTNRWVARPCKRPARPLGRDLSRHEAGRPPGRQQELVRPAVALKAGRIGNPSHRETSATFGFTALEARHFGDAGLLLPRRRVFLPRPEVCLPPRHRNRRLLGLSAAATEVPIRAI